MKEELVIEALTVEEAIEKALEQLEVSEGEIEFEVLEHGEKKIFGKDKAAKVRVWISEELEEDVEEGILLNEDELDVEEDQQPHFLQTETLTEEELDEIADTAIEMLKEVLEYFGAGEATVDEYEGEEGELILDIVGGNLAVLIGRHGKTLDSLQFLISSMVNKKVGQRYPIIIDIEGYKHRRRQKLESLAKSSAARAIRQRTDVRLRPMTPYERRIIHMVLKDDNRIITKSEGTEPNRQVVIKLR